MDYCLKRVSPSHPQENPEVREYRVLEARFRHPVGVAAMKRTGGEDSFHRIERAMSMAECKQAVLVEKETAHRDCLTGCYDRMTSSASGEICVF